MPTLARTTVRRPWQGERKPHERRLSKSRGEYQTARWKRESLLFKMQNPICAKCEVMPVEVTDHIQPVEQGGAMWDWNNWQPLCKRCHAIKSGKEAHGNARK